MRWELPGAWTERFDRIAVFQKDAASPIAQQVGMPNLKGKLALVNSPDRPDRHCWNVPYNFLSPRVGLAYRLTNKAVVRAGYGLAYLPVDAYFGTSPHSNAVNNVTNTWVPSLDGGITPYATLSNPFPDGLIPTLGRDPSFQSLLLGQTVVLTDPDLHYAYNQQWNLNLQFELKQGLLLDLAYVGAKGTHLTSNNTQYDQLDPQYMSLGAKLNEVVANPFYGIIKYGALSKTTTTRGQLLRPYPQYSNVQIQSAGNRDTSYNSMQVKLEKRFRAEAAFWAPTPGPSSSAIPSRLCLGRKQSAAAAAPTIRRTSTTFQPSVQKRRATRRTAWWSATYSTCLSAREKSCWEAQAAWSVNSSPVGPSVGSHLSRAASPLRW